MRQKQVCYLIDPSQFDSQKTSKHKNQNLSKITREANLLVVNHSAKKVDLETAKALEGSKKTQTVVWKTAIMHF